MFRIGTCPVICLSYYKFGFKWVHGSVMFMNIVISIVCIISLTVKYFENDEMIWLYRLTIVIDAA